MDMSWNELVEKHRELEARVKVLEDILQKHEDDRKKKERMNEELEKFLTINAKMR